MNKLKLVIGACLFSTHLLAHQFSFQNASPILSRLNVRNEGIARLSLKSPHDYLVRSTSSRHTHCFEVSTSSTGLIPSKTKICSTTAGVISLSVKSLNTKEGTVSLQEIGGEGQMLSMKLLFAPILKTSMKKLSLQVGECTPLSIQGGIEPYSFTTSNSGMGEVKNNTEFCADASKVGSYTFTIKDSSGQFKTYSMMTRGPIREFSMDPKRWNILYGKNMPLYPSAYGLDSWAVQFPQIDQGILGYITQTVYPGYLESGRTLRAQITIEADPEVIFDHYTNPNNTSPFPAHVRFMLQRGKTLSYDPMDRWWANPTALKLEEGTGEMIVSLSPEHWTNMNGQRGNASATTLAGFSRALREIHQVGFTFGGGYFFGHGVRVTNGQAKFILDDLTIE